MKLCYKVTVTLKFSILYILLFYQAEFFLVFFDILGKIQFTVTKCNYHIDRVF